MPEDPPPYYDEFSLLRPQANEDYAPTTAYDPPPPLPSSFVPLPSTSPSLPPTDDITARLTALAFSESPPSSTSGLNQAPAPAPVQAPVSTTPQKQSLAPPKPLPHPPTHQSQPLPEPVRSSPGPHPHSMPLASPVTTRATSIHAPPHAPLPALPRQSSTQLVSSPVSPRPGDPTSPPTSDPTTPNNSVSGEPEPESDPNSLLSKPSSALTHRDRIALEILQTERTYLGNLTFLVESFVIPLRTERTESGVPVLPAETVASIFSNIEEIIRVNTVLLADLEKRMHVWATKPCLGDIFEQLTHFFKMYNLYTSQYESALNTLTECDKNPVFVMFVKKWEDLPDRPHALNLRALLIQPVQRIPRYRLLLEDLLKHTPADHEDHHQLKVAVDRVKQVADDINESIKRAENRQKVLQIQNSFMASSIFASEVKIVEPSRVFIKEGSLLKICRKARKMRHFFLFNDILIYADLMPLQEKYIFHLQIELSKLRLQDVPDSGGRDPITNAFQMINQKKSFIVIAKSKEEKYEWMGAIMSAIDEEVRRKQTLNRKQDNTDASGFVFEAPLWVQDKDATHCFKCHDEFTFVNRRHHCRSCGNVVCGDCSSRKLPLPGWSDPQRVCVNCYFTIKSRANGVYSQVF